MKLSNLDQYTFLTSCNERCACQCSIACRYSFFECWQTSTLKKKVELSVAAILRSRHTPASPSPPSQSRCWGIERHNYNYSTKSGHFAFLPVFLDFGFLFCDSVFFHWGCSSPRRLPRCLTLTPPPVPASLSKHNRRRNNITEQLKELVLKKL